MIHELIGIHNNTVDLQGRPDVPDEMRKMTLSADLDEFYRLIFNQIYLSISSLGQNSFDFVFHIFFCKNLMHKTCKSINNY